MKNENELGISRRNFVKFMSGTGLATTNLGLLSTLSSCSGLKAKGPVKLPFTALSPSSKDELQLSEGFNFEIISSFGDALNDKGEIFGSNNDYTAFFSMGENEALLWVNHEYPDALFVSKYVKGMKYTKEMVDLQRESVGGSIIHIKRSGKGKKWELVKNSHYNRRITGTTEIPIIAPRDIEGSRVAIGTLANCAGGITPWNTVLTAEENYQDFYGEREFGTRKIGPSRNKWERFYKNAPEHYGWVVEVNPFTGAAKKLTSLGRFSHESATCVRAKNGKVVVYSGDDKAGEFVYKFISSEKNGLEKGELFVADIKKGRWLSLDIEKQPKLKAKFKDQLDVLIHCRVAGRILGATPLDRPEDIEVNPYTGDVFVALTNNKGAGNFHGSILKISEAGADHTSLSFQAGDFMVGGKDFSSPDNMIFDRRGNMWMVTDISGSSIGKGSYKQFGNNGLYYIPMRGPLQGKVFQIGSAPNDAELTGLSFSSDGDTLFLCVQHPGEKSKSFKSLTSHWPKGGNAVPQSSLVQITGSALDELVR
jgi:uncharacterized protein